MIGVFVGACAVSATLLTWVTLTFARRRGILDVPNERSSHTLPVPRGGGVAIVLIVMSGILGGAVAGWLDWSLARTVIVAGSMVAAVGWLDDASQVSTRTRFLVHIAAAVWVVWSVGGLASIRIGDHTVFLGDVGHILAVVAIVWVTNLYNFMDGIDGLAAGEAVVVGVAGALLSWYAGSAAVALCAAIVAAASAGFLVWNWSPARIFMGDVGSGFLGLTYATLAIVSEAREGLPATLWALMLGVFVFDATVTLLRRIKRGERWYAAHRSHAYQRAVQAGLSHAAVSSGALLLTLVLAAFAGVALLRPALEAWSIAIGVALLAGVYAVVGRYRPMRPALAATEPKQ